MIQGLAESPPTPVRISERRKLSGRIHEEPEADRGIHKNVNTDPDSEYCTYVQVTNPYIYINKQGVGPTFPRKDKKYREMMTAWRSMQFINHLLIIKANRIK